MTAQAWTAMNRDKRELERAVSSSSNMGNKGKEVHLVITFGQPLRKKEGPQVPKGSNTAREALKTCSEILNPSFRWAVEVREPRNRKIWEEELEAAETYMYEVYKC